MDKRPQFLGILCDEHCKPRCLRLHELQDRFIQRNPNSASALGEYLAFSCLGIVFNDLKVIWTNGFNQPGLNIALSCQCEFAERLKVNDKKSCDHFMGFFWKNGLKPFRKSVLYVQDGLVFVVVAFTRKSHEVKLL